MDLYSKYFVPFPTVRSGNVILRRMRKDDLPGLYDYCRRDESCRYSEWSPHRKPSDTAGFISWIISGYRRHESFTFAVTTAEGDVIGTASYMKHTGNKPMSITWHLDHAIPAKFIKKTNKLVVG